VIFGCIVIVGSVLVALLMVFAAGMSDSPSASEGAGAQALSVFIGGLVIGGLLIGSHWMHLSW